MRPYGGLTIGSPCGPRPHGPRLDAGADVDRARRRGRMRESDEKFAGAGGAAAAAPRATARLRARQRRPGRRSSGRPAEPDQPRARRQRRPEPHRRRVRRRRPSGSPPPPAPPMYVMSERVAARLKRLHRHVRHRRHVEHVAFRDPTTRPATTPSPDCREAAACRACRRSPRTIGGVNSGPILYCLSDLLALGIQLRREIDQIRRLHALTIERRRLGRKRLRRRIPLARRVARRHGPLFDRPTGAPVTRSKTKRSSTWWAAQWRESACR